MSTDEARRLLLHDAARDASGPDAALVLMEMLPPTGWADVATKRDLDALEERLGTRLAAQEGRVEARFDIVDARFEALRFELDARIERGQRRSIQWNVATLVTAVGTMTAILRLT